MIVFLYMVVMFGRSNFQPFSVFFPIILQLTATEQIHYRNVNLAASEYLIFFFMIKT